MNFLDFQALKVEPNDRVFLDPAEAQCQQDTSQFEMYNIPYPGMNIHEEYPTSFHSPHINTVADISSPGPRKLEGSENIKKLPHLRGHNVPLQTSTASSTSKPYNTCRNRAAYNGRRSTSERRDRINERERDRMHMLCDAFEQLRQVLPLKKPKRGPHRQKLSKISTLLFAQSYIRTLEDILRNPADYADCRLSPSVEESGCGGRGAARPSASTNDGAEHSMMFTSSNFYQPYDIDVFGGDPPYAHY